MSEEAIVVRGARVHNLRNIDFEIRHESLTVVTGVSGSGKSSLAFDTIYAEGQRRYIESLSAYARQFLERIEKPDVDEITGIAPAIAIKQKNSSRNPRSTVATATEIYDHLRLLFARIGKTYCKQCGQEVKKDTVDEIAARVLALPEGARIYVLFPLRLPEPPKDEPGPRRRKKTPAKAESEPLRNALMNLRKRGFTRLYQDGRIFEFSAPESLLDLDFKRAVWVLVDRLAISPDIRPRLIDSVEICYREAGETILEIPFAPAAGESAPASPERLTFNERFECKNCRITYQEPEPRLFSFNSPYGACPRCQGFGNTIDFDLDLVIPDKTKSLEDGAIDPWNKPRYRGLLNDLKRHAREKHIPLDVPFLQLSDEQKEFVIHGDGRFPGIRGFFAWLERKKYKLHVRVFLSRYRGYALCLECNGTRLREEARAVCIADRPITEICRLTIEDAREFFRHLRLKPAEETVAGKILEEIRHRLEFLYRVGLDYLTLDRLASTLAGGEAQRIQLATSLGSNLVGALYVLDEPSIGLHARDTHRLIDILKRLRNLGNTILVVEHDPEIIRSADRILDLGPGAGENGGRVIFSGDYDELLGSAPSLTGRYLSGELRIPVPSVRRKPAANALKFFGCYAHNLKQIDITVPLGLMVTVTGVSGSGKSSLVHEVIYRTLRARKNGAPASTGVDCQRVEGDALIRDVVLVDQSPIGRSPRSNPVTYIKAFDAIRELFAETPEGRKRGHTPGNFSFNIPGGRCETCQGDGTVTVEMQFLADVELVCEECKGRRFKSSILDIRYSPPGRSNSAKNIHEVLQMTVHEALSFFAHAHKVTKKLKVLEDVGLGYVRLGQSATTLSGGEAQRVKLAAHLAQQASERTLYIFDEPTTGLHFDDIQKLLGAFHKLLEAGATILVIEHNLDVIKMADWVIDLGPEGGERGGYIVSTGTPEQIARQSRSYTGQFLNRVLNHQAVHGRQSRSAGPPIPMTR